jgi:hypothetical protein
MDAAAAAALRNLDGNNNNNNNNEIEERYKIPANLKNAYPNTIGEQRHIYKIYSYLQSYYYGETTSLEMIQTFLKQYILALFASEGYKFPKWEDIVTEEGGKNIVRHLTVDKCTFLGTHASSLSGCKLTAPSSKLTAYMDIMKRFLLGFFARLSIDLKRQMVVDKATMDLFTLAIRNLLYFYGQKQTGTILSGKDNHFLLFFTELNSSFESPVIYLGCDTTKYGCGRFVSSGMCVTSKKYYVLIHATEGEDSMDPSANYLNVLSSKSKACGGRRKKTRKHKRKQRKTRKN